MQYTIRHVTKFTYESAISESVMEARMQPRSEGPQRCVHFGLSTVPASRVRRYHDQDGNIVHHFNIPGRHNRLVVTAEALVECLPSPDRWPASACGWEEIDRRAATGEFWELLSASQFARPTPRLEQLAGEIGLARVGTPLECLRRLTSSIYERLEYVPQSTRVDSPIDDALESRSGVCQDFTHVMIALVRRLGVPCRYVSGYLFQQADGAVGSSDGATHAWAEAWLPDAGWIGLDPTNNLVAGDHHIRVAVGRDYADVPPTRGVFKGVSVVRSELAVAVRVGPVGATDLTTFVPWVSREAAAPFGEADGSQQQ